MSADIVSNRKIEANRQNALKSTGPKTAEGKARSSKNATRHGLFARDLLLPGEDPEELKQYWIANLRRLEPRDAFELGYAEMFIRAGWKLKRLQAAEGTFYRELGDDKTIWDDKGSFERFQKYEQRFQNMMHRALNQLRKLQKEPINGCLNYCTSEAISEAQGGEALARFRDYLNEPIADVTDDEAEVSVTDAQPVLSAVEGPVLSEVEGPVLSEVEGIHTDRTEEDGAERMMANPSEVQIEESVT